MKFPNNNRNNRNRKDRRDDDFLPDDIFNFDGSIFDFIERMRKMFDDDMLMNFGFDGFDMPEGNGPFIGGYSISYRYGSDMDEPEIRINGRPVDMETFKKFMSGEISPDEFGIPIGSAGGNAPGFTKFGRYGRRRPVTLDARSMEFDGRPVDDSEFEEPFAEILYEDNESAEVTVELPGVDKPEDVIINYIDNDVTIMAEVGDRIFKKKLRLKFVPDRNKTEITGKNGVFQIIFRR